MILFNFFVEFPRSDAREFFFGGRAFPPRRPTRRGEVFPPCPPRERARREITTVRWNKSRTTRAEQQEQNNKSRTTRAEQEQNKSRTRAGQPPARGAGRAQCARPLPLPPPPPRGLPHLTPNNGGAGRAQCARPLPPFPPPAGLVAPHARAHSRSRHRPQGGSPSFPPKHIVQRERETIAPAFFISAARRQAAAPRGAPKSHFKCRHHFSLAQKSISPLCAWARSLRAPRSALPLPDARFMAGARGARRRLPLPLGRGCPLSRRRTRRLRSAPPPTPCRGLPASRGLPPPRRESGRFPRVARLPFIF